MSMKKKAFGIIGLVLQTVSLCLSVFPCVFKLSMHSFNPLSGEFEPDGAVELYNILFNPGKFVLSTAVKPMPSRGIWTAFAVMFFVFALGAVLLFAAGLVKKRPGKLTLLSCVLALAALLLTAVSVLTFSCDMFTLRYLGRLQYGFIAVFALQLSAVIFSLLLLKKEKARVDKASPNENGDAPTLPEE